MNTAESLQILRKGLVLAMASIEKLFPDENVANVVFDHGNVPGHIAKVTNTILRPFFTLDNVLIWNLLKIEHLQRLKLLFSDSDGLKRLLGASIKLICHQKLFIIVPPESLSMIRSILNTSLANRLETYNTGGQKHYWKLVLLNFLLSLKGMTPNKGWLILKIILS